MKGVVLESISEIDEYEDFFRNEVVVRRTTPNIATRRLFEKFPDAAPISLCFAMTITCSSLEEWQHNRSKNPWNEWEMTSYWLRATKPARFHSHLDVDIESAIFEIYRSVSMVNCDLFILQRKEDIPIKAGHFINFWSGLHDSYFSE